MKLNTIQIIALVTISLTMIKFIFMFFSRETFNSFTKSYVKTISTNKWLYFSIYMGLSILTLYFIKKESNILYTEILVIMMFLSFLLNGSFIGTNLLSHLKLDEYNWKIIGLSMLIYLFIMFKAIQEIFNF